jgi:hypothetical protein
MKKLLIALTILATLISGCDSYPSECVCYATEDHYRANGDFWYQSGSGYYEEDPNMECYQLNMEGEYDLSDSEGNLLGRVEYKTTCTE